MTTIPDKLHLLQVASGAQPLTSETDGYWLGQQRRIPVNNLLVIVGAGASFGARESPQPPLGKGLLAYIQHYLSLVTGEAGPPDYRYSTAFARFKEDVDQAYPVVKEAMKKGRSFEEMLAERREEPRYDSALLALMRIIVHALSWHESRSRVDEAFRCERDRYDDLIAAMRRHAVSNERLAFISFNYDLLLEQALARAFPDAPANRVVDLTVTRGQLLFKPHGSVDWWAGPPLPNFANGGVVAYFSGRGREFPGVSPRRATSVLDFDELCYPVIAHYAPGKLNYIEPRFLDCVREKAIEAVDKCGQALIVGLHIALDGRDDPILVQILDRLGDKRVLYVAGPNAGADADAGKERGFRVEGVGFKEALDSGIIESFLQQASALPRGTEKS